MEYHVSEYISRGKRFQLAELLELTENQIKVSALIATLKIAIIMI